MNHLIQWMIAINLFYLHIITLCAADDTCNMFLADQPNHTQKRVQPDKCYFTVQITGSNFECSL